jgi:hypothetical protein
MYRNQNISSLISKYRTVRHSGHLVVLVCEIKVACQIKKTGRNEFLKYLVKKAMHDRVDNPAWKQISSLLIKLKEQT